MEEKKIGGIQLEQVLAALYTQVLQIRNGNVFESEAKGTADEIMGLFVELGGDMDEFAAML